jgi:hypothetical protein
MSVRDQWFDKDWTLEKGKLSEGVQLTLAACYCGLKDAFQLEKSRWCGKEVFNRCHRLIDVCHARCRRLECRSKTSVCRDSNSADFQRRNFTSKFRFLSQYLCTVCVIAINVSYLS